MNPTVLLRLAGYILCAYLLVIPVTEGVLALLPLDLGLVSWRFTAVGILTQTFMTPMLGMSLAGALAIRAGDRRVVLLLALTLGVVAGLMLVLGGLFAVDALEVRQLVSGDRQTTFLSNAALAAVKIFGTFVWATVGTIGGLAFLRTGARPKQTAGVVFGRGQETESA